MKIPSCTFRMYRRGTLIFQNSLSKKTKTYNIEKKITIPDAKTSKTVISLRDQGLEPWTP